MIEGIEAVFFDIGGVLLDPESIREAHRRFVAEIATEHDVDPDRALGTWREELSAYFRERQGTEFRSAERGYGRAIDAMVGERVPRSDWRPAFDRAIDGAIRPTENAGETLEALAGSETVYLGVISDVDAAEGERILERLGFREYFESVTTSEGVGRTKPDPAVFASAIGVSGVDPGNSLFVGDRYENDMRGGSWAGFRTVAFGNSAAAGPEGSETTDPDGVVEYRISDLLELLDLLGLD